MHLHRRPLAAMVTAAAAIVAVIGVPTSSYASAPNPGYMNVAVEPRIDYPHSQIPTDFYVGDCVMPVSPGSSADLTRPDAAGNARLEWNYNIYTTHTNNYDVWHATFTFRTSFGNPVLIVGPVDTGRMYHTYDWESDFKIYNVVLDPRLYDLISYVEWKGAC